jgi:hypothetical protein
MIIDPVKSLFFVFLKPNSGRVLYKIHPQPVSCYHLSFITSINASFNAAIEYGLFKKPWGCPFGKRA